MDNLEEMRRRTNEELERQMREKYGLPAPIPAVDPIKGVGPADRLKVRDIVKEAYLEGYRHGHRLRFGAHDDGNVAWLISSARKRLMRLFDRPPVIATQHRPRGKHAHLDEQRIDRVLERGSDADQAGE